MADQIEKIIGNLSDPQILGLAAGAGLAAHAFYKNFEPTVWTFLQSLLVLSTGFIYTLVKYTTRSTSAILLLYVLSSTIYLATLSASIACYRLVWHPLRNFPGPKEAALWKIWALKSNQKGLLGYDTKKVHDQYGPVVRLGPNWLSFSSASTIPKIYGAGTPRQNPKGSWYDFLVEPKQISLQFTRDDNAHAARRKIWDQGFSIKALADYENDIRHRTNQLAEAVAKVSKTSPTNEVDMEQWSAFFSFEVMGDLAFGDGFQMLETGKPHFMLETMKESMFLGLPYAQISWSAKIFQYLPRREVDKRLRKFTENQVDKRIQVGSKRRDLFTFFLAEEGDPSKAFSRKQLLSDATLTIVAGSDTTSSVLTWVWFYLTSVKNRYYYIKLQEELDAAHESGEIDFTRLSRLPWLNAIINETMRLQPPVPGGLQRYSPKGGIVLDGVFVPEGTTISCGAFTTQRDPKNWAPEPDAFRPERWIDSDKEIVANKNAFIPFSFGPRSCPGKNLAYMECRIVLATLIPQYDARLKPGFDAAAYEASVIDCFTIQSKHLPLIMAKRAGK